MVALNFSGLGSSTTHGYRARVAAFAQTVSCLPSPAGGSTFQRRSGRRVSIPTFAALVMLAACTTTPRGSFCAIADPIRPANVDVLTDAEVTAILQHNEKLSRLCGVRP
jgi:hypothetical protein